MSGLDLSYYKPVVQVLIAYVALFYAFLYAQSGYAWHMYFSLKAAMPQKRASLATIKYGTEPSVAKDRLRFDRTVGNLMEQSVPFLVSLLLSAAFGGNIDDTARLGWIYIAFRSLYPFVFSRGLLVVVSTLPNYLTIFALLYTVIKKM